MTLPDSLRRGELGSVAKGRGAGRRHAGADAQAARRHAAGPAVRPRRHDAVAQDLRRRRGRRGPQAGLLRPTSSSAHPERPHRAGQVRPVLRQGLRLQAPDLPADSGHHRAPVQSARRRPGPARAPEPVRRAPGQDRRQPDLRAGGGPGLPAVHVQRGQRQARRDNPFKNKLVRQAFLYAIDRNAISEVAGGGIFEPAQQPFPPASPYHGDKFRRPSAAWPRPARCSSRRASSA